MWMARIKGGARRSGECWPHPLCDVEQPLPVLEHRSLRGGLIRLALRHRHVTTPRNACVHVARVGSYELGTIEDVVEATIDACRGVGTCGAHVCVCMCVCACVCVCV